MKRLQRKLSFKTYNYFDMKRKNERLDPIQGMTKSEASYEKLML